MKKKATAQIYLAHRQTEEEKVVLIHIWEAKTDQLMIH